MSIATPPDRTTLLALYRIMVTIREFEETGARLFAENRLYGNIHVSVGQEAVAAGVCACLQPADLITSTHRGHGHCIAKGGDLKRMMAELFGRQDGYCQGRAGSMHIADPEVGILGANGIVGGGFGMAVGAAYAAQVRASGQVAVAFFGEGAVAEGIFHESLNLAALWNLPVVFVCENNLYAEMSHVSLHLKNADVHRLASSYHIPGEAVDGNDVIAVYTAASAAVRRARSGGGPSLLECLTYRWHGHFEGDPQRYRDSTEVESWIGRDPIPRLKQHLLARGIATADSLAQLEVEAAAAVAEAVRFAEQSPPPSAAALTAGVYAGLGRE